MEFFLGLAFLSLVVLPVVIVVCSALLFLFNDFIRRLEVKESDFKNKEEKESVLESLKPLFDFDGGWALRKETDSQKVIYLSGKGIHIYKSNFRFCKYLVLELDWGNFKTMVRNKDGLEGEVFKKANDLFLRLQERSNQMEVENRSYAINKVINSMKETERLMGRAKRGGE